MQSGLLLERDFRITKADDLDLRPIYHYLPGRVRGHVLICMLACYLTWHLRAAWGAPKLPDSPSNRMDVWKGEVIAPTEEELLTGIQR